MITKKCVNCGSEFEVKSSRKDEAKYCSRECHYEDKRSKTICKECGKEFKHPQNQDRKFCSVECRTNWQSKNNIGENHPSWKKGVEVECEYCGKTWREPKSTYKFQNKISKNRFCSIECRANYQSENRDPHNKNKKVVFCDNCGKKIERSPSHVMEHNFCSEDCYGEWLKGKEPPNKNSVTIKCDYCGDEFEETPSRLRIYNKHYCSLQCKYLGFRGKIPRNTSVWRKQRKKALERDNYECQVCGSESDLCVHHIKPLKEFGVEENEEANRLENLITLCNRCHMKVEYGKIKIPT